jgi:hypothetical protein
VRSLICYFVHTRGCRIAVQASVFKAKRSVTGNFTGNGQRVPERLAVSGYAQGLNSEASGLPAVASGAMRSRAVAILCSRVGVPETGGVECVQASSGA